MSNEMVLALLALGSAAGAMVSLFIIAAIAVYVVQVIGLWKMYKKADIAGWKAIIPVYNTYLRYKLAWKPGVFWKYLILNVVVQVLNLIRETYLQDVDVLSIILSLIVIVAGIWLIVISVKLALRTAKAYGKGTGFGVLMWFFDGICTCVLGYGKSEYKGAQE